MSLFIFDLGKVLAHGLDTTRGLREGMAFDAREFGKDYKLYERALMDGWMREEDYYRHVELRFGKHVAASLSSPLPPLSADKRLLETARALQEKGHVCVIGSNTIASHWACTPQEILSAFSRAYPSYQIHRSKPEPCFFRYICSEEGFPCHDTYFIDDREENTASAESLGISTLLFRGEGLEERTERFFAPFLRA